MQHNDRLLLFADDELDIDALFFPPGGMLDSADDSPTVNGGRLPPPPLPGTTRANGAADVADGGPTSSGAAAVPAAAAAARVNTSSFTAEEDDHRPLFLPQKTSSSSHHDQEQGDLEDLCRVAGLAYADVLKSSRPTPDSPSAPSSSASSFLSPAGFVGFERPMVLLPATARAEAPSFSASGRRNPPATTRKNQKKRPTARRVHDQNIGTIMEKSRNNAEPSFIKMRHAGSAESTALSTSLSTLSFHQPPFVAPKNKRSVESTKTTTSPDPSTKKIVASNNVYSTSHRTASLATSSKAARNTERDVDCKVLSQQDVVDHEVADAADNDSIGSSDNSCVCGGLSIATHKSLSTVIDDDDKGQTVQNDSSAPSLSSSSKSTSVENGAAATFAAVADLQAFLHVHRLFQYLQTLLCTRLIEPILSFQDLVLNQWYPRRLTQSHRCRKRLRRALRVAVEWAFIVSSAVSAVFHHALCECFVSSASPSAAATTTTMGYYHLPSVICCYAPTKSAFIYMVFLFTPSVCDMLMHYFTLPPFLPHLLSSAALYACLMDTGPYDPTKRQGWVSRRGAVLTWRWVVIPCFMLYDDGFLFGDTNISVMRDNDAIHRAVLAFGIALLQHSHHLSPLAWIGLASHQLVVSGLSLLFGPSLSSSMTATSSAILAVTSLATLHHLRCSLPTKTGSSTSTTTTTSRNQ